MMMMNGRSSSRHPFTPAQWQELEDQTLFFKFIVSGIPIPPDLLFNIKGRPSFNTQLSDHTRWTCFQLGLSSHKMDPEPTRCRRTDGKKWRCSRPGFENSKYCERHMHRGKTRSRKPSQLSTSTKDSSNTNIHQAPSFEISSPTKTRTPSVGIQSNLTSISSATSDLSHNPFSKNTHVSKSGNFITLLRSDSDHHHHNQKLFWDLSRDVKCEEDGIDRRDRRQRTTIYQFIEESPQDKRDSWLSLVI